MSRGFYRYIDGKVVQIDGEPEVSARVQIITDSLPPGGVWHPADGKRYESKSRFRQATKALGCVEVGNEPMKDRRDIKPKGVKADILEAYQRHARI